MDIYNGKNSRMAITSIMSSRQAVSDSLRFSLRIPLDGPSGRFELNVAGDIAQGAFVALTGPSGAGKSTLLRIIAGLTKPTEGYLRVAGETWLDTSARIHRPTRERPIGFVFQDYALFPNMTVRGHIEYAMGKDATRAGIDDLLQLAQLEQLACVYPARLSGGQKQRLALIRALARKPLLLMLDEPFSALDPALRIELQSEVKRLHHQFGTTTILVSHDIPEILRMADRVIRLEQGRVARDGMPAEALGLGTATNGFYRRAVHLHGPDSAGWSTVLIDGTSQRMRYHNAPGPLPYGTDVTLHFSEADICISVQALANLTLTSRGGA